MNGTFDKAEWIAACTRAAQAAGMRYSYALNAYDTIIGFHVIDEPHFVNHWGAMAKCPGCGRCACCCTCPKKAA